MRPRKVDKESLWNRGDRTDRVSRGDRRLLLTYGGCPPYNTERRTVFVRRLGSLAVYYVAVRFLVERQGRSALHQRRKQIMYPSILAIFGLPGGMEWIVIGVLALLIFGRRLPDVARSVGKSIVEFKRGLRDVKNDMDTSAQLESKPSPTVESPAHKEPARTEDAADAATATSEDKS